MFNQPAYELRQRPYRAAYLPEGLVAKLQLQFPEEQDEPVDGDLVAQDIIDSMIEYYHWKEGVRTFVR